MLSSPEASVRRTAAGWLGTYERDPRAVSKLADLVANDGDPAVRFEAIKALHGSWDMMVDPAAAEALLAASQRRDEAPAFAGRQRAMAALMDMGACGGPKVAEAIREHLRAIPRTAPPEPGDL
jgi:hypothetical protein